MHPAEGNRLQTLRFNTPFGPWTLWLWTPAADLSASVATLWATEAQTVAFSERILPRQTVELMINFGGPQRLHTSEPVPVTKTFRRAWVSGLQTSCLEIESPSAARLICASLHPAHAGPLLGVTGRELAQEVIPLDEVIAREAEQLASRLEESPSVVGRFLLFEDFLRDRMRRARRPPHPSVCWAVQRMLSSGGQESIRGLSDEFGCSTRYLESRMLEEVGLSPKRLARLIRFSSSIDSIRGRESISLAELAHSCGYYDQAHFNRDFRVFAGVSPSVFLATRDSSSQSMLVE